MASGHSLPQVNLTVQGGTQGVLTSLIIYTQNLKISGFDIGTTHIYRNASRAPTYSEPRGIASSKRVLTARNPLPFPPQPYDLKHQAYLVPVPMEPVGAYRIFERPEDHRRLRYTDYYGDGDSKAFDAVKDIYGKDSVTKLECIGNIQKRVGTRLRKLKSRNKGLGGKILPKEVFVEHQILRLGSYIAVVQFNNGFQGLISILNEMGIVSGYYTVRGQKPFDNERIADSKRHSLPTAKTCRRKLRAIRKKKEI
ncbi:uncharacterized protein TNCV_811831 [Trichonephila clavipes]|nr:uncharacterized protein TNCV_811831 [Trichonephila clavipes]